MGNEFGAGRANGASGASSTGGCSRMRAHAGVQRLARDLNRLYRDAPRAARARISSRRASRGSTATTPTSRCSASCAARATARSSSWCSTSRRCRARGYRIGVPGAGRLSRDLQQRFAPSTAAATSATAAAIAAEPIAHLGQPWSIALTAAAARGPRARADVGPRHSRAVTPEDRHPGRSPGLPGCRRSPARPINGLPRRAPTRHPPGGKRGRVRNYVAATASAAVSRSRATSASAASQSSRSWPGSKPRRSAR